MVRVLRAIVVLLIVVVVAFAIVIASLGEEYVQTLPGPARGFRDWVIEQAQQAVTRSRSLLWGESALPTPPTPHPTPRPSAWLRKWVTGYPEAR